MNMIKRPMMFPNMPVAKRGPASVSAMTAQQKLMEVSQSMGVGGIKNQQGTTVVKYDTLPFDARTTYNFFQDSNTRPFPLSNMGTDGGKLGVGETMVIQRITLSVITFTGTFAAPVITAINPITKTSAGVIDGELTITVANSNVLLKLPIIQFLPEFNKDAENAVNTSYEFDTLLTIMPQLDFNFMLRCSGLTSATTALRMTVEGIGSIFSPRQTM